ncbi:MAG: hypothetical protein NC485_09775 [Ruminococcus flavefaciens]|nr:hypothetical protein [Ruminococcus flavefaciens]
MKKLRKVNISNNTIEMYGCYKDKFCQCMGTYAYSSQYSGSSIYHMVTQTTTTPVNPGGHK